MARYIDADRLIKGIRFAVCTTCAFDYNKEKCRCDTGDCITYIEDCPTADVQETKHGWWVNCVDYKKVDDVIYYGYTSCSACKKMQQYGYKTKYCPNCGAKMDGDADA